MQAFLYFDLTATDTYKYRQPLLEQVKTALPHAAILDMDAQSGELVQHYALKLLHDAAQAVVCIKADESITDISSLMPILEELFQEKPNRLALVQGHHTRLQRLFAARESIKYKVAAEKEVVQEVQTFFQNG